MKLSIVVPVYNMASDNKLRYCMDSLLSQTMTDYEIIAVDDASTDNSLDLLREYEKNYPGRVRVIASPRNRHQGGARNLGIRAAQGYYIGLMDSDDWAAPDMYEKLVRKAEETEADAVGCDYSLVHRHTMEIGPVTHVNTPEQTGILTAEKKRLIFLQPGSMVVKIYRRSIIVDNDLWFPEDVFYEDNCMAPLWLYFCTRFERVDEPLYYYYQHDSSTVHSISLERCRDRMATMELLIQHSKTFGFYEQYLPELEFKFTELYFVNTLFTCMVGRIKGKYRFVRELWRGLKEYFPDFDKNVYYRTRIHEENQKFIRLLSKSQFLFFAYYYALRTYRQLRRKAEGRKNYGKE